MNGSIMRSPIVISMVIFLKIFHSKLLHFIDRLTNFHYSCGKIPCSGARQGPKYELNRAVTGTIERQRYEHKATRS